MCVAYGISMAGLATVGYARRGSLAVIASAGYAMASAALSRIDAVAAQVVVPGALTLAGYWLSGLFIGVPQPDLERRLLASDRRLFAVLHIDAVLTAAPRWVLEVFEFIYSTVYLVVMIGALLMAPLGRDALVSYWSLVVPAELVCCAALPFLRSRPPRTLEGPGVIATRAPVMRRLNDQIVNRGSIQVNTIPSAHVASALAAGLAVAAWRPAAGVGLIVMAALIGVAATVGRYHYAIDCLLGAGVAVVIWLLV
jgi:hypothetical protein